MIQASDCRYPDARILVVDDNPINVELLLDLLDEAGYANLHSLTDPRQVHRKSRTPGTCSNHAEFHGQKLSKPFTQRTEKIFGNDAPLRRGTSGFSRLR